MPQLKDLLYPVTKPIRTLEDFERAKKEFGI